SEPATAAADETTTEEPTTSEPTTAEPTTTPAAENTTNRTTETMLTVSDESVSIDENNKQIRLPANTSVETFSAVVTGGQITVTDDGGAALSADEVIGTGCKVLLLDGSGNTVCEYTVYILMDVDGNGRITAADARLALRCAAKLEILEGVHLLAADADVDTYIKPADARLILRTAAKLD
ncbi:MAG: hypothetical protein LUG85_03035, partial [Clostridiales bacterium]|nr:hypothetical protein [Clostridiales bacterium]